MWLKRWILAAAACGLLLATASNARADEATEYAKLLEGKSPAFVVIKLVMKMKFGGQDREQEAEISGVMIDAKGLVLCANDDLNPMAAVRRRFGSRASEFSATPTDLKVLIGDDNEGVEAKVVSTDTELDLAWVQIKEPKGPYAFVDFSKSADAKVGQRIVAMHRLPKYFDRAAILDEGRVGSITTKPRKLYVPTGGMRNGSGFPVFTTDGGIVGFAVLQLPEEEEESGMGQNQIMGMILPAAEVAKATQRAKDAPQKPAEEASGDKKAADTDKDAKDKDAKKPAKNMEGDTKKIDD